MSDLNNGQEGVKATSGVDRSGRLIVRNLPFDLNQKMIRRLFASFGDASEVQIPLNPQNGKPRGFAFVQLKDRKTAQKAANSLNDSVFKGRKIGVALAVDKRYYQAPAPAAEAPEPEEDDDAEEEEGEEEEGDDASEASDAEDGSGPIQDKKLRRKIMKDKKMSRKEKRALIFGEAKADQGQAEEATDAGKKATSDDLLATAFASNLNFELTSDAFRDHAKKLGKINYAVVCKNRENPELNNGTGFIRFKTPQICAEVLRKYAKIHSHPEERVLVDPENNFEIEGRPLHLKQAISKDEAKVLNKSPNNASLLVKLKKGTISSAELVLLDREGKRNLKLALAGKVVTEDTVTTGDKVESEKRATHLAEKIEKMKNPNFKVSATRVLLKNINKELDEEGLKGFVKEKLAGKLTAKELKNRKLLKNVKILRDEQKDNRSKVG